MKLLIDITTNPANPIPPERTIAIVDDFKSRLAGHLADGTFESAYNIWLGHGFVIADVESSEAAWAALAAYQLFPYWTITMTPLIDPIRFMDILRAGAETRRHTG